MPGVDIFGIIKGVADLADSKAMREAAKDQGRRAELGREYADQMRGQRDRRTVTDYNVGARGDEIGRLTAQDIEQAKEFQGETAADFIRPRATLGLGGIAKGMRDRDMMKVDEIAGTNPLTGGSAWADALTAQHRELMTESGQDADDMSLLQAGGRRDVGDEEVLGQVAATQAGEPRRTEAMQQDAAVAKSDVGARGKKRKMDIAKKEQAIDKTYAPWIVGSADVARGSMGEAAKLGAMLSDAFKPSTSTKSTYDPSKYIGVGGKARGFGAPGGGGGGKGFEV